MIRQAGMVLAQLEIPMDTVECLATLCQREAVPLMLDPAPAQELPAEILRRLTWFTPMKVRQPFIQETQQPTGARFRRMKQLEAYSRRVAVACC